MLKAACLIARKDLRLVLSRGAGLVQALLLGLLLIFVFSLSRETGETMSGQGAATIFWLSSAFCQVLSFNMLYGLEEANGSRAGLLLLPTPVQSVLLGKAAAMLFVLLGVGEIYAAIMSRSAKKILDGHGIKYSCGEEVEYIINRKKDGMCPMEKAVMDIDDPAEAPTKIKETIEKMRKGG